MLQRFVARFLGRGSKGVMPGSIADALLQRDVLRAITAMLRSETDTAWDAAATLLDVPPTSDGGSKIVGPWSEQWLFTSAAGTWDFTVRFTPAPDGGTDFVVSVVAPGPTPPEQH